MTQPKSEGRYQKAEVRVADIGERLLSFAVDVVRFSRRLERTPTSRHLANQLMRAATSTGANYREACSAESRADFVHKLQLVLKETREAEYWLQLLSRSDFVPEDALEPLLGEVDQLIRILVKSVVTAKSKA
jgi:four helix bundle protein